ncbi:MAG: hypothetical protein ACK5TG_03570, partial [Planctomyces sp.]
LCRMAQPAASAGCLSIQENSRATFAVCQSACNGSVARRSAACRSAAFRSANFSVTTLPGY